MKKIIGILFVFNFLFVSVFAGNIPRSEILEIYNYGNSIEAKIPILDSNGMSVKLQLQKGEGESFQDLRKHIAESLVNNVGEDKFSYRIISNNREYDYYKTQLRTGNYSKNNCMAASAATITKWLNPDSAWSVEKVRNKVRPKGGYIYTQEIGEFFSDQNIDYDIYYFSSKDKNKELQGLVDIINRGSIIMTCADTSAISPHNNTNILLGKGYSSSAKHSYIISGYILFEKDLYFEVFDPADQSPRKRYFKAEQVYDSIERNWRAVFEVPVQEWSSEEAL